MSQLSSDSLGYLHTQKLLRKQGVGARSVAVQNKFVRKWAVWLILITILALFYVWSRVQVVQLGYELTAMKHDAQELSKQVSNLEMEIAQLKSPKRLEEMAKQKLGMTPPSGEQVVLIKPDL